MITAEQIFLKLMMNVHGIPLQNHMITKINGNRIL